MSFRNSIKRRVILRKMAKKIIKFHIFRFRPTFSMLSRMVVSLQKCKKHLCCNLFWVLQKYLYFDWAIKEDRDLDTTNQNASVVVITSNTGQYISYLFLD